MTSNGQIRRFESQMCFLAVAGIRVKGFLFRKTGRHEECTRNEARRRRKKKVGQIVLKNRENIWTENQCSPRMAASGTLPYSNEKKNVGKLFSNFVNFCWLTFSSPKWLFSSVGFDLRNDLFIRRGLNVLKMNIGIHFSFPPNLHKRRENLVLMFKSFWKTTLIFYFHKNSQNTVCERGRRPRLFLPQRINQFMVLMHTKREREQTRSGSKQNHKRFSRPCLGDHFKNKNEESWTSRSKRHTKGNRHNHTQ